METITPTRPTHETYPIGTTNQPWGETEYNAWRAQTSVQRAYQDVVNQINGLQDNFTVVNYGALSQNPERYPLYAVHTTNPQPNKPWILITGGVHGYETSGVQGALQFLTEQCTQYESEFNFFVVPCVSPWAYETINRWNFDAVDPNRSFYTDSPAEECTLLMNAIAPWREQFVAHFDLHETTNTDATEFRPALAAKEGRTYEPTTIPDGFYLVDDSATPSPEFQQAIINAVREVTHIAPADEQGQILEANVTQPGVIEYPIQELNLCANITLAPYRTTTEVYPDSPNTTSEQCNQAQVAAIVGGLNYLRTTL